MFHTWVTVLTRPGQQVFEAERLKPSATLATALIWTVLAGAITVLFELLHAQLYPSPLWSMWPFLGSMSSEFRAAMDAIPQRSLAQTLSGIITAPVILIISVGIQHLIASASGSDRIRLEPTGRYAQGSLGATPISTPLSARRSPSSPPCSASCRPSIACLSSPWPSTSLCLPILLQERNMDCPAVGRL